MAAELRSRLSVTEILLGPGAARRQTTRSAGQHRGRGTSLLVTGLGAAWVPPQFFLEEAASVTRGGRTPIPFKATLSARTRMGPLRFQISVAAFTCRTATTM